ncbi:uncharacterized protein LOC108600678 [Drosophila busckii]|uniref:uncharacterized protein LOC108600678 n=1 Tax=Drosophila busckii TaxID=30019 RepID=UPI001432E808|nr:uncharacterized protein LOC108600678 [Drosophila busckii]
MEKFIQRAQRILPSNAAVGRLGSIELNLWLAHLVGLPLTGLKKETRLQKYWILLLGFCVQFALFCYVGFELYDLCFVWTNVDLMTQNVVLSLTHVAYILKVINTYYHYDSLKDIVAKLSAITREAVLSEKQVHTFLKSEMKGKMVMLMYFHLVLLPGIMGLVWVLFFPDGLAGDRFPYRVRIPDFLSPTVQYFYMGISVALLALCTTTVDYLNVLLMGHICMHLKVLNLSFDELNNTKVDPYSWLVSIVKYHCELIVLRQKVERIYSLPVMLQFVSSVVIVAMTAFQVLVGDGSKSSVIMDLLLSLLCLIVSVC